MVENLFGKNQANPFMTIEDIKSPFRAQRQQIQQEMNSLTTSPKSNYQK
jgi:hypothetical protein